MGWDKGLDVKVRNEVRHELANRYLVAFRRAVPAKKFEEAIRAAMAMVLDPDREWWERLRGLEVLLKYTIPRDWPDREVAWSKGEREETRTLEGKILDPEVLALLNQAAALHEKKQQRPVPISGNGGL